jgi:GxxExxY protein
VKRSEIWPKEKNDPLTEKIIGLAIEVHRALGPGLLESAYEECLCFELSQAGIPFQRQVPIAIQYKRVKLDCGYRMDIMVPGKLVIEIKSVERLTGIHEAQLLTYMKLSSTPVGLLINFHTSVLKSGIRRLLLRDEQSKVQEAAGEYELQ